MTPTILQGDCRDTLKTIPDGTVQMCVTSPPYWGLRSYLPKGHPDKHREIGQEPTPEAYVETMVDVFREVRRCLHESGTLWLNLGDSYISNPGSGQARGRSDYSSKAGAFDACDTASGGRAWKGLPEKNLCMIPWRVALALQADGWWLRSVICWHKRSCMPESVTDRPTNSWEPIFLLAKSSRYFYDAEAVKEPQTGNAHSRGKGITPKTTEAGIGIKANESFQAATSQWHESPDGCRNMRNVWSLGPEPCSMAHFATYPTEIPRRAILAGTSARGCCPKCAAPWERVVEPTEEYRKLLESQRGTYGNSGERRKLSESIGSGVTELNKQARKETRTVGWNPVCECGNRDAVQAWDVPGVQIPPFDPIPCTVLDPFGGSGTTGAVAIELGRKAILCELNPDYLPLIEKRTFVTPGLALA